MVDASRARSISDVRQHGGVPAVSDRRRADALRRSVRAAGVGVAGSDNFRRAGSARPTALGRAIIRRPTSKSPASTKATSSSSTPTTSTCSPTTELVIVDAWPAEDLVVASRVDIEGRPIAEFLARRPAHRHLGAGRRVRSPAGRLTAPTPRWRCHSAALVSPHCPPRRS